MLIFHQTITRLRAVTVTNPYGSSDPDWTTPDMLVITEVSVQPEERAEIADGVRTVLRSGWRVFSAPGVDLDVLPGDRIQLVDGTVCEVVGEIARWPGPSQAFHHVEMSLQRVVG